MRFADRLVMYIPSNHLHSVNSDERDALVNAINALTVQAGGVTVVHGHGEYIMQETGQMVKEPIAVYTWWWQEPQPPVRWRGLVQRLIDMGEESVLVEVNHRAYLYVKDESGDVRC